ncbi:Response regulator transcription factor [Candidatus Magnetomoraceae bacterium gMMP-1]
MQTSLKIVLYCSNLLFGKLIKQLIEEKFGIDATVINCSDCHKLVEIKPDLLIIDFNTLSCMPCNTLPEDIKILLLGTVCFPSINKDHLLKLLSKGLIGFLPPMTNISEFKKAIKCIASGEVWFTRKKLKDMISLINSTQIKTEPYLTPREKEIIKMICNGYRNKEIIWELNISEQAVKSHLNRIYKKFKVSDRLQLALHALNHFPNYMNET